MITWQTSHKKGHRIRVFAGCTTQLAQQLLLLKAHADNTHKGGCISDSPWLTGPPLSQTAVPEPAVAERKSAPGEKSTLCLQNREKRCLREKGRSPALPCSCGCPTWVQQRAESVLRVIASKMRPCCRHYTVRMQAVWAGHLQGRESIGRYSNTAARRHAQLFPSLVGVWTIQRAHLNVNEGAD